MTQFLKTFSLEYRCHALVVLTFWTLNAFEKIGMLGMPRWAQIAGYMRAFGAPEAELPLLVTMTLILFTVMQGGAAVFACLALVAGPGKGYLRFAVSLSVAMFAVFIIGDIVAVERDRLLKHLLYATLFLVQGAVLHVRRVPIAAA